LFPFLIGRIRTKMDIKREKEFIEFPFLIGRIRTFGIIFVKPIRKT